MNVFAYNIPIIYNKHKKNKIYYYIYRMYIQETRYSSNIQLHHHNYLSEIRGDNDKLLEYISKMGDIY